MRLVRLLAALLLACSLPALAQDQKSAAPPSSSTTTVAPPDSVAPLDSKDAQTVKPWRMLPGKPGKLTVQLGDDIVSLDPNSQTLDIVTSAEGKLVGWHVEDKACYTIRSYVVARDDKNSDATHPVSYSTCRPSSRYGVKEAVERYDLPDGERVP